jgi:hypothetical protein
LRNRARKKPYQKRAQRNFKPDVKGQRVKMQPSKKKQICAVCILFNLERWFSLVDPILTHCLRNSIEFELYVVYLRLFNGALG